MVYLQVARTPECIALRAVIKVCMRILLSKQKLSPACRDGQDTVLFLLEIMLYKQIELVKVEKLYHNIPHFIYLF